MKLRRSQFVRGPGSTPKGAVRNRGALTLLEMMVSMTLLAVIMIGLVTMFNQTQKALRIANSQTDVFESFRGALAMMRRDLTEMAAYDSPGVFNALWLDNAQFGSILPTPSTNIPVRFGVGYWLTRANDDWEAIGYFVTDDESSGKTNTGVGSLHRFSAKARVGGVPRLFQAFQNPTDRTIHTNAHVNRISDGIVHFMFSPVYLRPGFTNQWITAQNFALRSNQLPVFVDIEVGILEPETLKQYYGLRDLDDTAARNFLRDHAHNIHFFRERVPIRNFINPYRANEVP